jgi:hypothetical protein
MSFITTKSPHGPAGSLDIGMAEDLLATIRHFLAVMYAHQRLALAEIAERLNSELTARSSRSTYPAKTP